MRESETAATLERPQRQPVPADAPTPEGVPLVDRSLVGAWFGFTLFWAVLAPVLGLIAAMKLDDPYFLGGIESLAFPRLRIAHVNGVILGLFSSAVFGFCCYAVPKLTGRPLASRRAAWWGLVLFNLAVFLGEASLLAGKVQPVEAGEYPLHVDVVLWVGYLLSAGTLLLTIARRRHSQLYVSLWYWTAGLLWTGLNLALGAFILPQMKGVTSAAMHGFYLHAVVGLWITPMGLGAVYYLLPVTARARLFSHRLSLIGFWGLALFYPLNGIHHYIYSPIADWAQTIAISASLMLLVPVFAFTINIWGTMRGRWREFAGSNYVLKFAVLGAVWYLATCIQGPLQAFRGMQALTHFGDFNVGHAHSSVYGAFAIWMMGAAYFIVPRIAGRALWSSRLAAWHYWTQILGFGLMFSALTLAGFLQGHQLLDNDVSWIDTVESIRGYWVARTLGGTTMDLGIALFSFNLLMTFLLGRRVPVDAHEQETQAENASGARHATV